MLEIKNIKVAYDKTVVIHDVSLHVKEGELVTILGANGAGKSTIIKTITGLVRPLEGEILLNGEDLTKVRPDKIVRKGVALCPEGRRVWPRMTVEENMAMGAFTLPKKEIPMREQAMFELFPRLKERRKQLAGTLSGGEQQMLAIARTLMSKPSFIIFDEPSLGLAPIIVEQVIEVISSIRQSEGATVLLVEQNANMALSVSDRGYVIESGFVAIEDAASNLANNEHVRIAYLGK